VYYTSGLGCIAERYVDGSLRHGVYRGVSKADSQVLRTSMDRARIRTYFAPQVQSRESIGTLLYIGQRQGPRYRTGGRILLPIFFVKVRSVAGPCHAGRYVVTRRRLPEDQLLLPSTLSV
jgi:hypothetical protein